MMRTLNAIFALLCGVGVAEMRNKISSAEMSFGRPKILDILDFAMRDPQKDKMFETFIKLSKEEAARTKGFAVPEDVGTLSSASFLHIYEWGKHLQKKYYVLCSWIFR